MLKAYKFYRYNLLNYICYILMFFSLTLVSLLLFYL